MAISLTTQVFNRKTPLRSRQSSKPVNRSSPCLTFYTRSPAHSSRIDPLHAGLFCLTPINQKLVRTCECLVSGYGSTLHRHLPSNWPQHTQWHRKLSLAGPPPPSPPPPPPAPHSVDLKRSFRSKQTEKRCQKTEEWGSKEKEVRTNMNFMTSFTW